MSEQYNNHNQMLCHADQSCLLVIDIQGKLASVMPQKVVNRLKKNSTTLIRAADTFGIPVFTTLQYPKGLGPLEQEISDVLPAESRQFVKTCFSCADADNFITELKSTDRNQVILAGMEAHVCVLQTALDLLDEELDVFVVGDAICSRQRENYENALERLRQNGVITTNTESVLFEWLRDAGNEHFKTISALIR